MTKESIYLSIYLSISLLTLINTAYAKDITITRTVGGTAFSEDIRNENLIYGNQPDELVTCARVYYLQSNGSHNSFVRIIKTDINGNLIWKYDYSIYPDPLRTLLPFSITQTINGDGYVVCGAINNDSINYGNQMHPFTMQIDENGNVTTFKEYTVSGVNRYAAALKIIKTPDGHYAMIGMESDEFVYLTAGDRMGFLAQLSGNLQVN